jgi:hypothetical protein
MSENLYGLVLNIPFYNFLVKIVLAAAPGTRIFSHIA